MHDFRKYRYMAFTYQAHCLFFLLGLFLYLTIKGYPLPHDKLFHLVCWGAASASVLGAAFTDNIQVVPMSG
jgi:hypothetical protein